jgi:Fe2+ or Zn2+ uptake regulation protein
MTYLLDRPDLIVGLKQQGHKITLPRQLVLERLAIDENFTAEGLVEELTSVGRATVYRTLKLLLNEGLICRVVLDDGSVSDRLSGAGHHHHLVCVSCHATQDIPECDLEGIDGIRRRQLYRPRYRIGCTASAGLQEATEGEG